MAFARTQSANVAQAMAHLAGAASRSTPALMLPKRSTDAGSQIA
jgi:hypothetical protein